MPATPVLTSMRRVLWAAFDANAGLRDRFVRTYRFDETDAASDPTGPLQSFPPRPGAGELPALAIYPSPGPETAWTLNDSQKLIYRLDVNIWTNNWNIALPEELWELLVRCWWAQPNPATGGQPFWRGVPGIDENWLIDPSGATFAPYPIEPENPDSPIGTETTSRVAVYRNWNPRLLVP